ncbi:hypothetical protein N7454_005300 [Penicillium verhagenii]|nr:hypothetical protein N7454_005300 [Penicillium verhagenii]
MEHRKGRPAASEKNENPRRPFKCQSCDKRFRREISYDDTNALSMQQTDRVAENDHPNTQGPPPGQDDQLPQTRADLCHDVNDGYQPVGGFGFWLYPGLNPSLSPGIDCFNLSDQGNSEHPIFSHPHGLDNPDHLNLGTPTSPINGLVEEIGENGSFGNFHEPAGAYGIILGNAAAIQSPENTRVPGSSPPPAADVLSISRMPGDVSGGSDQPTRNDIAELGHYDLNFFNSNTESGLMPIDMWYKTSDALTLHLPRILCETPQKLSKEIIDDNGFEWIHTDASMRLGLSGSQSLLFSFKEVQEFTGTYIDSFQQHLPFIHLPSFSLVKTPCPLVLAMASIGALYRLKRRRAYQLHELATKLEYQWRRNNLQMKKGKRGTMMWKEWIEFEETKRTLCAMFIFSDMLLITFDITPGFVVDRDLIIEIPDRESLWNATSAEKWEDLNHDLPDPPDQTIKNVVERITKIPRGNELVFEPCYMTGFSALVVMHAVDVYLWHLNKLVQPASCFPLGVWPHDDLRTTLLHSATLILERCQAMLLAGRGDEGKICLDNPGHNIVFNCEAVLRIAFSRLLPVGHSFNRLALLMNDRDDIMRAVQEYSTAPLERTNFVTKAAKMAYDGFLGPVTIGTLLVRKTAALDWSVDQAIAGWDSALLLTKWIHVLEITRIDSPLNNDEAQIFRDLEALLVEMELKPDDKIAQMGSMAAMLAGAWASFLDDTWVWGVTPKMGLVLRQLGAQFQEQWTAMFTDKAI